MTEDKTMLIKSRGKSCEISPALLISDFEIVNQQEKGKANCEYKKTVAQIIASHSKGVFTSAEINKLGNLIFEQYIDLCVESDDILEKKYNELNGIDDINERFINALLLTSQEYAARINESLKPLVEKMATSVKPLTDNISGTIAPVISFSQSLKTFYSKIQIDFSEHIKPYLSSFATYMTAYDKYINSVVSSLHKLLKTIQIPGISEEEKQQRIDSYETWGKLGWTMPPDINIGIFNEKPISENAAYNKLREYINDSYMEKYFKELHNMKHIRKADLNEAIDCFHNKHYKACAMIIYSMIDSRLIRAQRKEEKYPSKRRPSGKVAAEKLFGRFKAKDLDKGILFFKLNQLNILSALQVFFENANDFKEQPQVINRNFLDHGMLHRKVLRKDCAKLFLLLYNFTSLLDSYYE